MLLLQRKYRNLKIRYRNPNLYSVYITEDVAVSLVTGAAIGLQRVCRCSARWTEADVAGDREGVGRGVFLCCCEQRGGNSEQLSSFEGSV
jgi:hypothetical protein